MATDEDFEALAERLTDPATPMPLMTNISTGADAAAHGRALMLREYGGEEALEAVLRRAGRAQVERLTLSRRGVAGG